MFALTDREKGAHLLRRFGMGASEAELDFYMEGGLSSAIDKLLASDSIQETYSMPLEMMENDKGQINMTQVLTRWSAMILMTRRPLLEKMTVFWHNHFATGADKVTNARAMNQQNEVLRTNALGSFHDLLLHVSKDPAMLQYLDGADNIKGRANENFAREIMELFTLGVGHYTEEDIRDAAKAFTGWSYRGAKNKKGLPEFQYKPNLHDDSVKTVLGRTGKLTGDEVVDILCSMPRTAEFITTKIWNWFVYPNPSPETLKPFVKAFSESGLNIRTLVETIMRSEEFYSERSYRKLIKNPVDFCLVTLRSMGLGELMADQLKALNEDDPLRKNKIAPALSAAQAMRSQGMWLLYPPDVSGWKPGDAWITSATMLDRINWANKLFGVAVKGNISRYPIYNLLAEDPTPFGIAKKLCSIYDAPITGAKLVKVADAAEKAMTTEGLTAKNANKIAAACTKLIFGSPEFQFA